MLIRCPLWSDNNRLNAEAVIKVAEEARSELLRADPSLHINTAALAPTLPPPSAGPHTDIPGADNIAVSIQLLLILIQILRYINSQ